MKNVYIKDIHAGDKVVSTFLVWEKNLAYSQKGLPYLNLRLKDQSGELDGKVWEKAMELDKVFKKGDILRIHARAVSFKNMIQLSVLELEKMEEGALDPTDYFPAAKRGVEEMFAELMGFVERVADPWLKQLLEAFFQNDEIVVLFKRAAAAKGFHHVYVGGLLEHTLSVTRLLDLVTAHYEGINKDMVIAGGILHDIGKIYELSSERTIEYTDPGRLVGHIVMGVEMVNERIAGIEGFPLQTAMELRHLILSHHGTLEFGSPKRPKTVEALVVHFVDDMDAKVNAFQKYIESARDEESDWTPYHRLFERYIYKGA